MQQKIKVYVLSNDILLKSALINALKINESFDVVLKTMDFMTASLTLNLDQANIFIIDSSTQTFSPVYIERILKKYIGLILFIGENTQEVKNISLENVEFFGNKPIIEDNYAMSIFVKNIDIKSKDYMKKIANKTDCSQNTYERPVEFLSTIKIAKSNPFIKQADNEKVTPVPKSNIATNSTKMVAIASSTGGTEALVNVLKELPANIPPILIVQHMPAGFTTQFANRLDSLCNFTVVEAYDGLFIQKGIAYLAPGDFHMRVVRVGARLSIEVFSADRMHGVRPAADILFDSLINIEPRNIIGVVLTGMGVDGAKGLLELHERGSKVIGQDKSTCVVYGMPKAAFEMGAVDYVLPLSKIADKIVELL